MSLKLPMESFRPENLNPHCFMNFRVQDEHGRILGQSRNLAELRTGSATRWRRASSRPAKIVPADAPAPKKGAPGRRAGAGAAGTPTPPKAPARRLHRLDLRPAARAARGEGGRPRDRRLPALHDDGAASRCALRHAGGGRQGPSRRLHGCSRWSPAQVKAIEKLPGIRELALQFISYGSEAELKAQLVTATLERCCLLNRCP